MIIGFVCSRKDNKEFEIVKGSPPFVSEKFYKKLYCLLKPHIFDLKEHWLYG